MGERFFEIKELALRFTVPDPLLGKHWEAYWRGWREAGEDATALSARYVAAVAIIKSWQCERMPQLPRRPDEVELQVVAYVGSIVLEYIQEQATVPLPLSARQ